MSNVVVKFKKECLICGQEDIAKVCKITVKSDKTRVFIYAVCKTHETPSSSDILAALKNHPERSQETTISGLKTDSPNLSEEGYVRLLV